MERGLELLTPADLKLVLLHLERDGLTAGRQRVRTGNFVARRVHGGEATLAELAPTLVRQEFGAGELILRQGAFPKALALIAAKATKSGGKRGAAAKKPAAKAKAAPKTTAKPKAAPKAKAAAKKPARA